MIAALLLTALAQDVPREDDYYVVEHLPTPDGERFEVGGLGFLSDGRLVVSTRRGQVWLVEGALADDLADVRYHLFAEGLQDGLGLSVVDDVVHVVQRGELSRLVDEDGDDVCDRMEVVTDGWGLSGNYHEFAFGLPRDAEGNFYVSLNVSFFSPKWWLGQSPVPYRGWVLRITPDGDVEPFACGFRSPCGLGFDAEGNLLATDNQGDWVASSPILHVQEGRFYGHPASLAWRDPSDAWGEPVSDVLPPDAERTPPAIWIPYAWSRSTGNLVPDTSGGAFGPFDRQLFIAEMTNGSLLRGALERVQGELQGWVAPFRLRVGSACRVAFAPDGSLFAGLTNRGWGGLSPSDGIARVRWTGRTPFEVRDVHLLEDGFEIDFTQPVAPEHDLSQLALDVRQYDYDYWWEYGSPERHEVRREVASVQLSRSRTSAVVRVAGLEPAMCARVLLPAITSDSGEPLLHREFAYTINQLPGRERTTEQVSKVVEPPTERESGNEGIVWLMYGDAQDSFESAEGWELCDVDIDLEDPTRFARSPGWGAFASSAGADDLVTRYAFGDIELHVEFYLAEGAESTLWLQDRYGIRLADGAPSPVATLDDCAALLPSIGGGAFAGRAPDRSGYRGAGDWHELDVVFRAPRFDASGDKLEDARLVRMKIDDVLLHEAVALPAPSEGARGGVEAAEGPVRIAADDGLAIRILRVRVPAAEEGEPDTTGWTRAFDGETLAGWTAAGGDWRVEEGELVGSGSPGTLWFGRAGLGDFEVRARVQVAEDTDAGLLFRAAPGEAGGGYEAQLHAAGDEPAKTGSLVDHAIVRTEMVEAGTWLEQRVRCTETPEGTRVEIWINGVKSVDWVDPDRGAPTGQLGIAQQTEGGEVRVRSLELRELGD